MKKYKKNNTPIIYRLEQCKVSLLCIILYFMGKLQEKIKTKDDFDNFCELLMQRLKQNKPISDNPMIDGMVISFIVTTNFAIDLFLQREMGRVLDGTIQKLEQIAIWCTNNEDKLCRVFAGRNQSTPH